MIRKVTVKDISSILKVIDSVLLKNIKSKNKGFLMHRGDAAEYKYILQNSKYNYVAIDNKKIIGFLLTCPLSKLKPDCELWKRVIEKFSNQKYILIYHLGIRPEYQRKGYGKKLYQRLFKDAKDNKLLVLTSSKPRNIASEKFHLSLGFKIIDKIIKSDDTSNLVYER